MFIEDDIIIVEVKIDENEFEKFFNSNFDLSPLANIRMSKYTCRSFFMNFIFKLKIAIFIRNFIEIFRNWPE